MYKNIIIVPYRNRKAHLDKFGLHTEFVEQFDRDILQEKNLVIFDLFDLFDLYNLYNLYIKY